MICHVIFLISAIGTILNKSLQIPGFADDLDIITWDMRSLSIAVDTIADDMDLQMNIAMTNNIGVYYHKL